MAFKLLKPNIKKGTIVETNHLKADFAFKARETTQIVLYYMQIGKINTRSCKG